MITIGKSQTLRAERRTNQGIYLVDETNDSVLLPNAYLPKTLKIGDEITVFVYLDQEERPIATPHKPMVELGGFAALEVSNVVPFGAFFRWGPVKELLVPIDLQATPIREEEERHIIHVMFDDASQRLVGTTKITPYLIPALADDLKPGQPVYALIYERTELGFKAVVEQKYEAMVYHSDLFKQIRTGQNVQLYVRKIRPDGKVDLVPEKFGYQKVLSHTEKLLRALEDNNGFLPLHDKSPAELIYDQLQMSKKVFKKSVGALYKQRKIKLEPNGIRLVQ